MFCIGFKGIQEQLEGARCNQDVYEKIVQAIRKYGVCGLELRNNGSRNCDEFHVSFNSAKNNNAIE